MSRFVRRVRISSVTTSPEDNLDKLTYTVTEVAELLGISRTSAYECVRRGEIPSLRLGRRLLVTRAGLEQLLDLHSVVAVDRL